MTNYEIPLSDIDSFFDLRVDILNTEYILEFIYNNQGEFWSISMYTADKTPIFLGRKVVLNYDLFSYCSNPLLPIGSLRAIDESNTLKECGFDDLGNRVKIIYTTP